MPSYQLVLTIVLTLWLQFSHAQKPGYCTEKGNLYTVSNNDCTCFHQRDLSNGNEGYHYCGEGTTFNAARCTCDHPGPGNNCQGSKTNKCPEVGKPPVITTNVGQGWCVQNFNKYTISNDDCTCFHQLDTTNGNNGYHRCPAPLTFNPAVCVCDWPWNSKCKGSKANICPDENGGNGGNPTENGGGSCTRQGNKYTITTKKCTCFKQEDISNGNFGYHWCPLGTTFNPAVCVCDWPWNSKCKGSTKDYCPRPRD